MKKYIYNLFIRVLLSLLLFIVVSFLYSNNYFYNQLDYILFDSNIDFSYIRSKTNKVLKNIIGKDAYVSSYKLEYKSVSKYDNSFKFITDSNYVIKNIKEGTVIFIGNKSNLGSSVSILSDNGIEYIYSNIENINVNLYDYINKDIIIGSVLNNYFYLTLIKDNKYLNYEEYI